MDNKNKVASEEMKDATEWMSYYIGLVNESIAEHDLEKIEMRFEMVQKWTKIFSNILKDCDRRIDYGEEWDQ